MEKMLFNSELLDYEMINKISLSWKFIHTFVLLKKIIMGELFVVKNKKEVPKIVSRMDHN